ncbi:EAL domain-containing protein [Thalassotalea maritima]|uniref:EAL domain-containing protein n=1 Tax=Thalassotalea maritima TaxID=3242416 RepID=UPI003528DC7F
MRVNRLAILISIITLVCSSMVSASNFIGFKRLDDVSGLLNAQINRIYQQSNGYIWLATAKGVFRYDGHDFQHFFYSPGEAHHISNNFVLDIVEDADGYLWLATEAGLNRIKAGGEIDVYDTRHGLGSAWVLRLHYSEKLGVVAVTQEGVFTFNKEQQYFQPLGDASFVSEVVAEDNLGNLYFPTPQRLIKFDVERNQYQYYPYQDFPVIGGVYSNAAKYVGDSLFFGVLNVGLIEWNSKTQQTKVWDIGAGFKKDVISDIELYDDALWLSFHSSGLMTFDLSTQQKQLYQSNKFDPYSLPSNGVLDIHFDHQGSIWLGLEGGVVQAFPNSDIALYQPDAQFNVPITNQTFTTHVIDNELYVSTVNNVLKLDIETAQWQKDVFGFQQTGFNGEDLSVWAIDHNEHYIWFATDHGLFKFERDTKQLKFFSNEIGNPHNLLNREIYTVLVDGDGVWITGYIDVGLAYFSEENGVSRTLLKEPDNLYSKEGNFTYKKIRGKDGRIWMATTDGIFVVDSRTNDVTHFKLGNGAGYVRASDIAQDKDGTIWVSTQGEGLVKILLQPDGNLAKARLSYVDLPSLPSNDLYSLSLTQDSVWLTSSNRIIELNKQTLQTDIILPPLALGALTWVETSSSILNDKFLLATNYGVLTANLSRQSAINHQALALVSIQNDGVEKVARLSQDKPINLSGDHIKIMMSAFNFATSEATKYRYRLNSSEDYQLISGNTIEFHKLWPGQYQLELSHTGIDGKWQTPSSTFRFNVIIPAYYYLIVLSLVLFIIGAASYTYTRRSRLAMLKLQAVTDPLTGLKNREGFNVFYQRLLLRRQPFTLILFDLDRFKDVNDLYGHKIGDKYIQAIAKCLGASIRDRDMVARLSGDEFAVILTSYESGSQIKDIVQRIHNKVQRQYAIDGINIDASLSAGAAVYMLDGENGETLYNRADAALYESKNSGRGQLTFFNAEIKEQLRKSILVKTGLKSAIEQQQFELYYQPKVCSATQRVEGYEALIRWQHPKEGFVSPEFFIKKAEESGDILEIGRWVLEQACADAKLLNDRGLLATSVSVNISAVQLKSQQLVEQVASALAKHQLPADKLELEVTETSLIDNMGMASQVIKDLQVLGVSIALDDFGHGYSSLNYLSKIRFNTLKLDRSLIDEIEHDEEALRLLKTVFNLGAEFDFDIVAEGIETNRQFEIIAELPKCRLQGYLFSKPVPLKYIVKRSDDVAASAILQQSTVF